MTDSNGPDTLNDSEIAVIGMAGRFPGAENIHRYWENLKNGVESISYLSDEELEALDVPPELRENPNYVKTKGGVLENKEYFDASFFGYTPKEAEIMDPQLRVFHECAWHALEDAGYAPGQYNGSIGIYAGAGPSLAWEFLTTLSGKREILGSFESGYLVNKDFLSTHIAYKLNLKGPAFSTQTACSTSLAAIHLACQAILNGECHMALAGGIKITPEPRTGYLYQEGMINSPDGHCRAFDAQSKGTVNGDGAGVVLLKLLEDAIAHNDHIYAVIKGTAVNNDGVRRVGFSAPSIEGQADVIRLAHRMAEIQPDSISYIETHGTATQLGDPIEIEALKLALNSGKRNTCAIGSVKTNIGHLDVAAGIAGLIKTILALNHRQIPPSLHFNTPNPKIDFENSPFYVNNRLSPWKSNGAPRRAGVSSFGIGGTNTHIVLEEWTDGRNRDTAGQQESRIILLSAKTPEALDRMTQNLTAYLKNNKDISLADAAYTLATGRTTMEYKRMAVSSDINAAVKAYSDPGSRMVHSFFSKKEERPVIFLFPGLGAQYTGMGKELYLNEPVFRDTMDQCFSILKPLIHHDIKGILYPGNETASRPDRINEFEIAQLAVFCLSYSLAKLLEEWGVKPDAMMGYSFGEYTAACIAGVFSLEDALKLVVARGRMIGQSPPGAMSSVPFSKEEVAASLTENSFGEKLSIAIDNGSSCVVAGPAEEIAAFEQLMRSKRCMCVPMPSSHALHSNMMTPVAPQLEAQFTGMTLNTPKIPYISNLTGKWAEDSGVTAPAYWGNHLTHTVQFANGIMELVQKENAVFIEVGPGRDLSALLVRYTDDSRAQHVLNLVRPVDREVSDRFYLLNKIGWMWLYGLPVDWRQFYTYQTPRRIPLPGYPFERRRYWLDEDTMKQGMRIMAGSGKDLLTQMPPDMADWFYLPLWKRVPRKSLEERKTHPVSWLVFANEILFVQKLAETIEKNHRDAIIVKAGTGFEEHRENGFTVFTVNPQSAANYDALFGKLQETKKFPHNIIHCWGITNESETGMDGTSFDRVQETGFYSLLYTAKAIGKQNADHDIHVTVLSDHVQDVTGSDLLCPAKAPILGLIKSIPQEYPGVICNSIDIDLPEPGTGSESSLIQHLMTEFTTKIEDMTVAFRDNQRWVQFFDTFHLEAPGKETGQLRLKEKGIYLITGGLGLIGLLFSQLLVKHARARLILTGRSPFPARDEWDQWLESHGPSDPTSMKIEKLRELQDMGGEICYIQADSALPEQMRDVLARGESTFGKINGFIHAAGVVGGDSIRLIQQLTDEDCRLQFSAKVHGTMVLDELFKNENLDFRWLISSISCFLGGLGLAAYGAANQFMDLLVKKLNRSRHTGAPWLTLNWEGMEEKLSASLFERVFTLERIDQVLVSRGGNFQERIDQWVKLESLRDEAAGDKDGETPQSFKTRANVTTPYIAPASKTEIAVAEVWRNLLGFDDIGADDDFFELGGDSLKAINLTAQLKKEGYVIALTEVLANPTVKKLAAFLDEQGNDMDEEERIYEKRLLSKLDCIEKLNDGRNSKNLFILHPMHGMLIQYTEIGAALEKDCNVYGIQARGVVQGSRRSDNPDELMDDYVGEILRVQSGGTFHLAGYCTGINYSYAIAIRLERMGHQVGSLTLLDAAPILTRRDARLLGLLNRLPGFVERMYIDSYRKRFKKAKPTWPQKEKEMVATSKAPNVLPGNEGLKFYIGFLAAFVPPLGVTSAPILIAHAREGSFTHHTREEFAPMTKSDVSVIQIPGNHDSMLEQPNVEHLARAIREHINPNENK